MKKVILSAALASVFTMGLVGCAPGQNTGGATVVGAATGGLLAGALFRGPGSGAAVIAGALIGGSLGYAVGRQMDEQDRINMQNAIVNTPDGQEASWTNSRTTVTYIVEPVQTYHSEGRYCRRYKTRIRMDGRWRTAYGHACRTSHGWKIVS
jgi:surface antigen